jgi:hypothetical protein
MQIYAKSKSGHAAGLSKAHPSKIVTTVDLLLASPQSNAD